MGVVVTVEVVTVEDVGVEEGGAGLGGIARAEESREDKPERERGRFFFFFKHHSFNQLNKIGQTSKIFTSTACISHLVVVDCLSVSW